MELIVYFSIFIVSLVFLVKSADVLVDSAEKIGLKFKLPYFFIGSIIIGFGTSLPELATSIISSIKGIYEIPVSNVVGSNITNILLIVGLPAFLFSIKIKKDIIKSEIPFLILSSILVALFFINNKLSFFEGVILLIAFFSYIIYIYRSSEKNEVKKLKINLLKEILKFIISLVILSISSNYTIEYLIKIAESLGLKIEILSAILLALGTSLPELTTSFNILLKKKEQDMIIGNIIGSNIINIFLILGITSLISFSSIKISKIMFELSILLLLVTFLFSFIIIDKKIEKEEGFIFLIIYFYFVLYLFFQQLT